MAIEEQIADEFKKILRRLESVENTLNLVHKDRNIFEDISIRVGSLEDKVKYLSDKIAELDKKTMADMKDVLTETQKTADNTEEVLKVLGGDNK